MKKQTLFEEIKRMQKLAGIIKENKDLSDLTVHYYKNPDNYGEKGLADDFHEEDGKKVKYIVGYDDEDEMDDIGYIYTKSGDDIETKYSEDDLYDVFYNSLESTGL